MKYELRNLIRVRTNSSLVLQLNLLLKQLLQSWHPAHTFTQVWLHQCTQLCG